MSSTTPLLPGVHGPIPKRFQAGTHRLIEPEATVARLTPLLPRMGITRVANVTGLDRVGLPVVMVCRPNSRQLAVSQGKGITLAAAKASGIMESVEGYHAERIALPMLFGTHDELSRTHRLVNCEGLNRRKQSIFHPRLPILWVEGFDLLQQEPVWVPYEMVTTNYTLPHPPGAGSFYASSNGLASGNHLLEAVSHGICEIVERDAGTLMGLSGLAAYARLAIDLDTIDEADCRHVVATVQRAGLLVGVWEMTSDVGVPAFQCKIGEPPDHPDAPPAATGYGCHPSRAVALSRAVTEAVQSRLTFISGSRDDMWRSMYDTAVERGQPGVDGPGTAASRSFQQVPTWEAETLNEDVGWLLGQLSTVGIERVIAVNLSRPEFDLAVARVLIPGMEAALLGPGELALGLRARTVIAGRAT